MSNKHLFLKSAYLTAPSQNGVGRYVCQLQRVVLKFCKSHGSSRGMRDFIESELVNFAKEHPGVVVYLKPRRHRSPLISAEYLNGDRQLISCHNLTTEVITKWMNLLRTQAGNHEGTRIRKNWHTEYPSIQGPWTPYTFREPSLNTVTYPNLALSQAPNQEITATQHLLEIFKQNQKTDSELESKRAE